jgi:hypothetical protein
MSLGKRMLKNIKQNPMMFKDLGAAVYMGTNMEKTKAMYSDKEYTGSGDNSAKDMATFRRMMEALGYGYGGKD